MAEKADDKDQENHGTWHFKEEKTPGCYVKSRMVLAMMALLTLFNFMLLRNNLSVAIVAMVNYTVPNSDTTNVSSMLCPDHGASKAEEVSGNGQFNWDTAQQGFLLGSYYYGYIVTNIPGGYLSKKFGFRMIITIATALSSVITLLTPVVANTRFELLISLRILLGLVQGVTFPSVYSAWGSWAPPLERSYLLSIALSGVSVGRIVALPVSGVIADKLGWEYVFYVTGIFSLLWTISFFVVVRNSPEEDPWISDQEKEYIVNSIKASSSEVKDVDVSTPWFSMFTSLPLWGIMISHFANNFGNATLDTVLPTYMASILRFNVSASGALTALPYVLKFFITIATGSITFALRSRGIVGVTALRKINTSIGMFIPALFIVLAGYIGCNVSAAVAFFSLSAGFSAFSVTGNQANVLDIAPKYSGIAYGISNTFANIAGMLSPQVAGLMLVDENTLAQWQNIFWVSGGIFIFGGVVYLALGTGEEQSWAHGKVVEKKEECEIAFIGPSDNNAGVEVETELNKL